jgi:hypothetical protein
LPIFPQSKLSSGEEWVATKTAWPQGEWKMSEWWCPASGQNRRTQKTPRSTVDSDSTRWGWLSLVAVDLSKISIVCFRSELMATWPFPFRKREGILKRGKQAHNSQMVLGVPLVLRLSRSSMWLHIATNRSKNNLPPISISICMVPLRLNVFRLRIMSAR